MTEKLFASIGITLFMNDIKEKIVEKLFLSLPLERQKEILIEIFIEEKNSIEKKLQQMERTK